jgi:hypothetical protein
VAHFLYLAELESDALGPIKFRKLAINQEPTRVQTDQEEMTLSGWWQRSTLMMEEGNRTAPERRADWLELRMEGQDERCKIDPNQFRTCL